MSNIAENDVRNRLRSLTSVEVTDAILDSPGFIPAGDGWLNKILSNNGYSLSTLGSDDQAMAKAAEIAFVAAKVIGSAPLRGSETGLIKIKPISSKEKVEMIKELEKEWRQYLDLIGCQIDKVYFDATTGDDYKPDGEDLTNLLTTDEDKTTHSMWP